MTDRQPTNPGRIKIIPEDGSPAFYRTVEMADNPVVEGTALNKANLLSDDTASAILPGTPDPTPDQALEAINTKATQAKSTANAAMPKAGGTFTGDAKASEALKNTRRIVNEEVRSGSTSGTLQNFGYFVNVI